MKVALVHDWLVSERGGERVLEAISELFPAADLYTLIHQPGSVSAQLESHAIHASWLQHVPGARKRYRHFLPVMPAAILTLALSKCDLVISSSHCVAKAVRVPRGARHLSYVHAPMRYMWDRFADYFGAGRTSASVTFAATVIRPWLQRWDRSTARTVDRFLCNSRYIAEQIQRHYGRRAAVIPPPVDVERFAGKPADDSGAGGYFLWLGALAPYKRVDLAVEAFRRLRLPLWIAGTGQDAARLRDLPPHIRWLGHVEDADIPELYRNARALIFPGEEDFGIAPVEAQASGRPVIALGRGGALETVTSETGLFFHDQSATGLVEAVRAFESWERDFRPATARAQALRFEKKHFQRAFMSEVTSLMATDAPRF